MEQAGAARAAVEQAAAERAAAIGPALCTVYFDRPRTHVAPCKLSSFTREINLKPTPLGPRAAELKTDTTL